MQLRLGRRWAFFSSLLAQLEDDGEPYSQRAAWEMVGQRLRPDRPDGLNRGLVEKRVRGRRDHVELAHPAGGLEEQLDLDPARLPAPPGRERVHHGFLDSLAESSEVGTVFGRHVTSRGVWARESEPGAASADGP